MFWRRQKQRTSRRSPSRAMSRCCPQWLCMYVLLSGWRRGLCGVGGHHSVVHVGYVCVVVCTRTISIRERFGRPSGSPLFAETPRAPRGLRHVDWARRRPAEVEFTSPSWCLASRPCAGAPTRPRVGSGSAEDARGRGSSEVLTHLADALSLRGVSRRADALRPGCTNSGVALRSPRHASIPAGALVDREVERRHAAVIRHSLSRCGICGGF